MGSDCPTGKKICVCVLGMHRSGTSALSRVLNLLGVYLGQPESMMEAHTTDNPTGYWEVRRLETIHKRILDDLGVGDVGAEPLPEDWMRRPSAIVGRREIQGAIGELFMGRTLWGFKDPRVAILLPLWQEVFAELALDVRYVIVVRDPRHVAASLGRRTGDEDVRIYQLAWHYYTLSALSGTRGAKRGFVSYQELIGDWRTALLRADRQAGLGLQIDNVELGRQVDDFLQPSLERSAAVSDDRWAAPFVAESYELISTIIREGESTGRDDRVQELLDQYVNVAGRAMAICSARMRDLSATSRSAQAENALLRERLDAMHASWSWKSTAPLRVIRGLLKRAP